MHDYSSIVREIDDLETTAGDNLLSALLVIYFPRLDEINLQYGYTAGEHLIKTLTGEIEKALTNRSTLARIGRQEFAILMKGLANTGQAVLAAQKICDISSNSFALANHSLSAKFNIGVAYFPHHGKTSFELIQKAGIAAKAAADKSIFYCVYSNDDFPTASNYALEDLLRSAIENAYIKSYYQPIVELRTGRVMCFESLARWKSDKYGFVSPATFVGMAEKSVLIRDFTILTLNNTLRQYHELKALFPDAKVSVNLSAVLLNQHDVVEIVKRALNIWDTHPDSLILEITESAIMEDKEKSSTILKKLRDLGIKISIDDFGTGQASFRYLKHLPINEIKIDKSFIQNINQNTDDLKIVKGIIDLAHSLSLDVVAEGIENEASLKLLDETGCEYGQGFFFARPMPTESLSDWKLSYEYQQRQESGQG